MLSLSAQQQNCSLTFYWMDSTNCTLHRHIWLWYENKLILTTARGTWIKFLLSFYRWLFFPFSPSTIITIFPIVSKDIFRNCTNRMYAIYWQNSSINLSVISDSKLNGPRSGIHSPLNDCGSFISEMIDWQKHALHMSNEIPQSTGSLMSS